MPHIDAVDPSLLHAAFLEAFSDYAMDASGTTEARLLLRMQKNAVDFGVSPGLYDRNRLVGFTLIGIDTWGDCLTAFDAGTGIVPEYRKKGWAGKLFDHALPSLRERGVKRFALEVLRANEPAINAYRRSGFEISRGFRCYVAEADDLRTVVSTSDVRIGSIVRDDLRDLEGQADWLPSFENRFGAVDVLPGCVEVVGALEGRDCVGAAAYCPHLNWLLTLIVDRAHRRHRIGTALIGHLATLLPSSVSRLVVQNVDRTDEGMQAFFESLGFVPLVDQYEMVRQV